MTSNDHIRSYGGNTRAISFPCDMCICRSLLVLCRTAGGGSIYPEFGSGPCHHGGGRAVAGKALQQKAEKAQVVPQPETPHPDFGGTWWDTSVGARTSRAESPMLSPALHEAVRDSNLPQEVLSGELNLKTKIRPLNWSLEGLA